MFTIILKVDAVEGEESTWVSKISEEELTEMKSLLEAIFKNNGYFPTDNKCEEGDPRADLLYSSYPGWKSLITRLPTPISGYRKIVEIHVFSGAPTSLYM